MTTSNSSLRATLEAGDGDVDDTGPSSSHTVNHEANNSQSSSSYGTKSVCGTAADNSSNNMSASFANEHGTSWFSDFVEEEHTSTSNDAAATSNTADNVTISGDEELGTWQYFILDDYKLLPEDSAPEGWRGHTTAELADMIFTLDLDLSHISTKRFDALMGVDWDKEVEDGEFCASDEEGPGAVWDLVPLHSEDHKTDSVYGSGVPWFFEQEVQQWHLAAPQQGVQGWDHDGDDDLVQDQGLFGRRAVQSNTPAAWAQFVRANERRPA